MYLILNVSQYDCFLAPYKVGNTVYSWWNDRDGNSQYFWSGNNANGIYTCQCGIDGNCVDSSVTCNCDSLAKRQLTDSGKLYYFHIRKWETTMLMGQNKNLFVQVPSETKIFYQSLASISD
jgi:hypothetical protein